MADFETLIVTKSNGVASVTLNRPEVRNAISQTMRDELRDVWTSFRYDDEVNCIVLSGAGHSFCTGIDRAEAVSDDNNEAMADGVYPGYPTPWMYDDPGRDVGPKSCDLWKPVIGAVQGMACGGAFYMLGETEFIISSDDATFFDPHVTYGMPAVYEPLLMLHRGMPFGEILRMTLLGNHERMSAERAHQIGLVSEVCPSADLAERAGWLADAIASAPTRPMQATLRTLWAGRELTRRQALDLGNTFLNLGMNEEDLAEGQRTFAAGRVEPRVR